MAGVRAVSAGRSDARRRRRRRALTAVSDSFLYRTSVTAGRADWSAALTAARFSEEKE